MYSEFWKNRRANVAITFALSTIPMVLAVGAAVDYASINNVRTKLDAFADTAAISTVTQGVIAKAPSTAQIVALNTFYAQASSLKGITITSFVANVTDNAGTRNTVVTYSANVPTKIMGIAGFNTIAVRNSVSATSATPTYADFYLLLDNTPSMGIGATPNDIATLQNATPDQCGFACHEMDTSPNDYYSLAKRLGVTMRIDVVRTAAQSLTNTAQNTQAVPGQFRMAIYSFGAKAETMGLTNVAPLSSNLPGVSANAASLDLMTIPYQLYFSDQQTDFDNTFASLNNVIANPGDGSSSGAPQKYVFFVSDGLADAYYPTTCSAILIGGTRCQEGIKSSNCDLLKNRGIKVAVLYTTYMPLSGNWWYDNTVAPINQGPWGPSPNSQIAQRMQACASPGLFFEVSPTQGISDAMNALFLKVVKTAHLSK